MEANLGGFLEQSLLGRVALSLRAVAPSSHAFRLLQAAVEIGTRWVSASLVWRTYRFILGPWHENEVFGQSAAYSIFRRNAALLTRWLTRLFPSDGILEGSLLVKLSRKVAAFAENGLHRQRASVSDDSYRSTVGTVPTALAASGFLRLLKNVIRVSLQHQGLLLLIFLFPFLPTRILAAGLITVAVLRAGSHFFSGRAWKSSPVAASTFVLGAVLVLATLASVAPSLSLPTLAAWFLSLLGLHLVVDACGNHDSADQEDLQTVVVLLLLAAVLVSAVGILQFAMGIETPKAWIDVETAPDITTRVFSVFDNPTMLAQYLTMILPLALFFVLQRPARRALIGGFIAFVAAGAALVFTFSRGGWVSGVIALLWYGTLRNRWLIAVLLLLVFLAPLVLPPTVMGRVESIGSLEESSNRYRVTIWKSSLDMLRDNWLTGIGLGTGAFSAVYPRYVIAGTRALHGHNLYLQLGIELGIPGLLVFAWFILLLYKQTLTGIGRPGFAAGFAAAAISGMIGQLAHAMVDHIWYSPKLMMFTFLMMGLALAASRRAAFSPQGGR